MLIAAQPTRGLDIGAARFVHERFLDLRARRRGLVVISEDLEELLGNLLENAMKWARGAVTVSVGLVAGDMQLFEIVIEDDGPGIPEDKAREALKRGRRLDETKPGTGLGLAIVADLVNEYGGALALERSGLGGLRAVVRLRSLQ